VLANYNFNNNSLNNNSLNNNNKTISYSGQSNGNNCWKCGSDKEGNKPKEGEFKSQNLSKNQTYPVLIAISRISQVIAGLYCVLAIPTLIMIYSSDKLFIKSQFNGNLICAILGLPLNQPLLSSVIFLFQSIGYILFLFGISELIKLLLNINLRLNSENKE